MVMMDIKTMQVGALGTNCYIVSCKRTKEALIIDPGGNAADIVSYVRAQKLTVKAIVDTHGHGDHIAANDDLREALGAKLYIHEKDQAMLASAEQNLSLYIGQPIELHSADECLKEGDKLSIGDIEFTVLETPGHTPGGISLYTDEGAVFSGDTLFYLSVGRTDFPGGSMRQLNNSITEKLFLLPDDTTVYPGHGPATNIGTEKMQNPFVF